MQKKEMISCSFQAHPGRAGAMEGYGCAGVQPTSSPYSRMPKKFLLTARNYKNVEMVKVDYNPQLLFLGYPEVKSAESA